VSLCSPSHARPEQAFEALRQILREFGSNFIRSHRRQIFVTFENRR
jgi:hypothetical protein